MLGYNPDRIRPPINYRSIYIFSYNNDFSFLFPHRIRIIRIALVIKHDEILNNN
jgi:hypothetical protein